MKELTDKDFEIVEIEVQVPDPWITIPEGQFTNGWTPSTPAVKYMKHPDGSVELVGKVIGGTAGATAFTLGEKFRPDGARTFFAYDDIGVAGNVMTIASSGAVSFLTGTASHSGIFCVRFLSAIAEPFPLSCFPVYVKTKFNSPPESVLVLKSDKYDRLSYGINSPAWIPDWEYSRDHGEDPFIRIKNIQFLEYGRLHKLKLLIIGDKNAKTAHLRRPW